MSLPSRVWIVYGVVVVIVAAGFLMLSQALVANAVPGEPDPQNLSRWEQGEPPPLDCSRSNCHSGRVELLEIHDILGSGIEACRACHGSTPGGGAIPPNEGGEWGHDNKLML